MTTVLSDKLRPIANMLLLLVLLDLAKTHGHSHLTRTQIHKFFFLIQRQMIHERILASGFRFHKMPQGPWSTDIETIIPVLEQAGLITSDCVQTADGKPVLLTGLTSDGEPISQQALTHMANNNYQSIIDAMTEVLKTYSGMNSEDLANLTHGMQNLITHQLIDDAPLRKWIQIPISPRNAKIIYEPSDDLEETLEVLLDADLREMLDRSIEDARQGRIHILSSLDDLEDD
ncbi:MAG: hypothetical protein K9W43_13735 [Candidatus Thorarchaeota archaeon]|nr:hypothetical protein [Candidatus Thorarchaeota archaeon]